MGHLTFAVALALVAGAFMPVQAGINASLRPHVGSPEVAAFVSFTVGTLALALWLMVRRLPLPLASALGSAPWWTWTGGTLGAFFVAASVFLAQRLGAGFMSSLFVAGQMLMALVLDHYGLLGYSQHPLTLTRVVGALCIVVGVVLVR